MKLRAFVEAERERGKRFGRILHTGEKTESK